MLSARDYAKATHRRRIRAKRIREKHLGTYRTGFEKREERRERVYEKKARLKEQEIREKEAAEMLAKGILDDRDVVSRADEERDKYAAWKDGVKWTRFYRANKELAKTNLNQFTTEKVS